MAEELLVVLNRKDHTGFGFSLLGKPGLPPIIYNILEDSPAAESGEVEVGDAILKVNETDVNRLSTKEVLKCLRLSSDPVTLKIKRDPKIKATVRKHLLSTNADDNNLRTTGNNKSGNRNLPCRPEPAVHKSHARTNGSCPPTTNPEEEPLLVPHNLPDKENDQGGILQWQPLAVDDGDQRTKRKPKFEAYMMTGEHILNISRTPQSANIIGPKQKKFQVDNLRYHNSHHQLRPHIQPHHHHHQHHHNQQQQHNSVPNSPNEMDLGTKSNHCRSGSNSANTSPIGPNKYDGHPSPGAGDASKSYAGGGGYVRTSRSEDQLQGHQHDNSDVRGCDYGDDEEDDMTSSLNTLLDTRPEAAAAPPPGDAGAATSNGADSDRIVWTYNAPNSDHRRLLFGQHALSNGGGSHSSSSPTSSSSPAHSGSPASPTSVSSSVMSSGGGSSSATRRSTPCAPHAPPLNNGGGDLSVSEAISNISSPDYHDDDDSIGVRECNDNMQISDQSDSDSTLLVSEPRQKAKNGGRRGGGGGGADGDHRIVIQVKGPDKDGGKGLCCDTNLKNRIDSYGYQISYEVSEQTYEFDEDNVGKSSSPHSSEDDMSDVESLHSFHYSPKAVDLPSAVRLAKRLYCLDGFKKSDVSRHLSKNNDFSRAVAEEYLKYFAFENDTLDTALRKFLKQFSLIGETQERERVLVHFSKRYLDCNPGSFNSQDAVHTLTCAIMLLNTDLHGQNINRKMTCNEFIENLAGLNECDNFAREVLKHLYHAIKNYPLEWALDEDVDEATAQMQKTQEQLSIGGNPFLDVPISSNAVEYKKGYVMRKCCYEADAKKTRFHKRSWKMFYCTLRDLVLYLHKDENGFKKNQMGDNFHNAIRIHHALATKASDYTKKQFVFRLQTADQAEYLFQTSDSRELQSWIDTINFICASFSARPLEAAVGSQKKFQRPLLPCSLSKLNLRDQLRDHEERVHRLEVDLEEHRKSPPEKGSKSLVVQNYKEKEHYLTYEVKRYRTYAYMLRSRISQYPEPGVSLIENSIGEVDEATGVTLMDGPSGGIVPPPIPDRPSPSTNRRSPSD